MKPKKKKKRYETIQQITREIDAAHAKVEKLLKQAEALDAEANMLLASGPGFSEDVATRREQAIKLRKQAFRLEQNRIPFLKGKCGEFLTGVLPLIDNGDKSIQAR